MLVVDRVCRSFGKVKALDEISFAARSDEVVALVGPNGAGKTTLFRLLATLIQPDSGRAEVCGYDTVREAEQARLATGAAYCEPALYDRLTPIEMLRYFGRLYGLEGSVLEDRIAELLQALDLDSFSNRQSKGLSRGMKQRVVLARAVLHEPSVLLLDEPTTGLDFRSADRVLKFLSDYNRNRCVLFATHSFQEVSLFCNRLLVIDQGRLVMDREIKRAGADDVRRLVLEAVRGDEG